MKMKKVTFGFSILAACAVFVISCGKKKDNVVPEQDTEVQSALHASVATFIVTDIDMMCSFIGENTLKNHFYAEYPNSSSGTTGTVGAIRDTNATDPVTGKKIGALRITFNQSKCMDGRIRQGTIFMDFLKNPSVGSANAKYMHSYAFEGDVAFSNYRVDDWLVELSDGARPLTIKNKLPSVSFNPLTTDVTWEINGKLKFTNILDPRKNMIWEGTLYKTLLNTDDKNVYKGQGAAAINWSLAAVDYYGSVEGTVPQIDTSGNLTASEVAYKMKIENDSRTRILRDFQCAPDKVAGIQLIPGTSSVVVITEEFHPFKNGVASFTVGNAYPRQIYYGNEVEAQIPAPEDQLPAQCDNKGIVLIKGISYRVDFKK
jgi:hypothetical protein